MSFTLGRFDFCAQIETSALDVATHVIYKTLERQNRTKFQQSIGAAGPVGGTIDVELVDLRIPRLRTSDITDRFRRGNTLATFQVDATLTFVLTLFGQPFAVRETLTVLLKDLQVAIFTTTGGLPVGVALGVDRFDIDVTGLTLLRQISPVLNVVTDFIALGIRTALSPLGLTPIPIVQFADAFVRLGLLFDAPSGSPYVGTNQSGTGLFLAADFAAANNTAGDITLVQDILPSSGSMNIGAVASDRVLNQVIGTLLVRGELPRRVNSGGVDLGVNTLAVRFDNPATGYRAHIGVDAAASGRIKVRKGGFFSLFGGSRRVTMYVSATIDVDAAIAPDPATQLAILQFDFSTAIRGQVTIRSVLAAVLTVVLGPFVIVFLLLLTQLLNVVIDFFLPLRFSFSVSGSTLALTIEQLATQLQLGPVGLTSASLQVELDVRGRGRFELDHFTRHQIQSSNVPIAVDYRPESLASRPEEVFLGAGIRAI